MKANELKRLTKVDTVFDANVPEAYRGIFFVGDCQTLRSKAFGRSEILELYAPSDVRVEVCLSYEENIRLRKKHATIITAHSGGILLTQIEHGLTVAEIQIPVRNHGDAAELKIHHDLLLAVLKKKLFAAECRFQLFNGDKPGIRLVSDEGEYTLLGVIKK